MYLRFMRPTRTPILWMIALLVLAGTLPTTASAQARRLLLVSTVWPPFTNEPGQSRLALDLVETALKRLDIGGDTSFVDEARFTTALLGNDFDGSAAVWHDADRERSHLYSQPYLENRLILVGRRGSDVSATALTALKGKTVAIVGGYSYGDAVQATTGPTWVRSNGEEDSVRRLLRGEVDYTLIDELVVQYIGKNYAAEARTRLQLGSTPLIVRTLHFALRRSLPDAEGIIRRFNAELRGMIVDRSYHRLLQVDWIRADVDGDGSVEYVPRADQVGALPPAVAYDLHSTSASTDKKPATQRFSFGGNIYESWATVPDRYKRPPTTTYEAYQGDRIPIFSFTW